MKLIDLTNTVCNGMPVYPGDIVTEIIRERSIEKDKYNAMLLKTGLHAGTHIDAPMHMLDDARTIDMFAPECFAGNGILLDVRGEGNISFRQEYDGMVKPGDVVLLYTGFDVHFYECGTYFSRHPVVSNELADFFIERKIRMLGMDIPSPDFAPHTVHKTLLSGGVFILENLNNLGALVGIGEFDVLALPLKIKAEASLARAVALLKE